MCTAIAYKTKDFYFGRTLDYEFSYGDEIVITPRRYKFSFRLMDTPVRSHYAMIGMAHVADNYPLYYEAVNEKGLGMAGLNFVGNAVYHDTAAGRHNAAPYELIPWILGLCSTVDEARKLLQTINIVRVPFSESLPLAELHWMIAGHGETIVVECMADGLHIYNNPVGVLTNNPPFNEQMFHLNNYMSLSSEEPCNRFCEALPLQVYSRGMGALGLPGDLSSQSRFVRASFVKMNSVCGDSEEESLNQFFHIIHSVEQQKGCCRLRDGKCEYTLYTSCCNATRGVYYYTTYENHQITAVDMHRVPLDDSCLTRYMPVRAEQIRCQN